MGNLSVATILIADFDACTRELCSSRFHAAGFEVFTAAEGRHALETGLAARPDIVSASIFLPAINGVELCRRLKRDRRTSGIRVILHSGTALLPGQCKQAYEAGCDVLLTQPCLPGDVFDEAQRLVPAPLRVSPTSQMVRRLYREYVELPTLRLTLEQVQRLVGVNEVLCGQLLDALLQVGFLCRTPDGYYARPSRGTLVSHSPFRVSP
jgi:CheY-like chemotaxis protein